MAINVSTNLKSSWKLCLFGSFMGCFLTLLCLDYNGYSSFDIVSGVLPSGNPIFSRFLKPSCGSEGGFPVQYPTLMMSSSDHDEDQKPADTAVNNNQTSTVSRNDDEEKPPEVAVKKQRTTPTTTTTSTSDHEDRTPMKKKKQKKEKCNLFDGRWVHDPSGNPDYRVEQCPFLSGQVSCQRNGRPDSEYEKWRWQPEGCSSDNFPRFDAINMLELLKGKRVVIVGDSLNRNQWESLACLLYSALPPSRCHVSILRDDYKVFKSLDYNCSVEFFWSPFLVQLEDQKARNRRRRILKLDQISASAPLWQGADVMVFNSGHWWTHPWKIRAWDFFQNNGKLVKQMEIQSAFETAISTWAKWIDHNVNSSSSTKTSVFFRSISPEHKVQGCSNSTEPMLEDGSYDNTFPHQLTDIVTKTVASMKTPVRLLNVTKLSGYRIDAHPAIYARKQDQASIRADCSHWCLPGPPDTWNTLIYAMLILDRKHQT